MILVSIAMHSEFDRLAEMLNLKPENIQGLTIYKNDKIAGICTGIGKVNSTLFTQKALDILGNVDCIFNYGFVGGMSDTLKIGDYVVPEKMKQHDLNPELFEDPNEPFVFDQAPWTFDIFTKVCPDAKKADFCLTGDRFVTEKIPGYTNALCDMESTCIAKVAFHAGVPFTSFKLVSDLCEYDGYNDFFDSVEAYSKKLQEKAVEYLVELSKN